MYFKYFLKQAWLNLRKRSIYTSINILGLTVGISGFLLIYIFVSYDLSFDKSHKNIDRIYRIVSEGHLVNQHFKYSGVPMPLAAGGTNNISGIEVASPVHLFGKHVSVKIQEGNSSSHATSFDDQSNIVFTDRYYFKIFKYEWIAGSPASLAEPYSVVLTADRAKLYFPLEDMSHLIGRTIIYNDSIQVTVQGIVKNPDHPTDLTFEEFISFKTIQVSSLKERMYWNNWGTVLGDNQLFVQLSRNTKPVQVEKELKSLSERNAARIGFKMDFHLQALSDLHFKGEYGSFERQADLAQLGNMFLVAVILLGLGCINFANLALANASKRVNEISIRKVLGGTKKNLVFQFLTETFLQIIIATLLSIISIPFLLQAFREFVPPGLTSESMLQFRFILFSAALIIVLTFVVGAYPGLVLSRFNPIYGLKNLIGKTPKKRLTQVLTITQLIVAQGFITATIIVGNQLHYTEYKELGFNRNNIVTVNAPADDPDESKRQLFLKELKAVPSINKVILSGFPPVSLQTGLMPVKFDLGEKVVETMAQVKLGEASYFDFYNIKLIAGKFPTPSNKIREYVINETFAKSLGFKKPAEAIGKYVDYFNEKIPVVGVIADFNSQSLHHPIKPLAFASYTPYERTLSISFRPGPHPAAITATLDKIENIWEKLYPGKPFKFQFLDDSIALLYKNDQKVSKLLSWATILAIVISCLGILGLSIHMTYAKRKEIGVRKILGSSVLKIVALVYKDLILMLLLACSIAVPVVWWLVNKWIQRFVYRVDITAFAFISGVFITFFCIFIVTGLQIISAARANPINSLRTG